MALILGASSGGGVGGNGGLSGIGIGGQTSGSASAGTSSNDQFSPPSALELKNLKDQTEMLFGDDGSEINDIVEKMKVLRGMVGASGASLASDGDGEYIASDENMRKLEYLQPRVHIDLKVDDDL